MKNKPLILIADDDPRNIFALKAVLAVNGFSVLTASNGIKCLEVLQNNPTVNLILMDMMMPEMDGYEAIREVRSLPAYDSLPIIAVTAQAMTGDKEKCLAAGADDYVSKPINAELLLTVMQKYLSL